MNTPETTTELSPELTLLVAAARPRLDAESVNALRAAATTELNWDRLVDHAAWHGLTPLLAQRLNEHCHDLIASPVSARLTSLGAANARYSQTACEELLQILDRLKMAGVTAVPFKGPVQALQLYGDPTLREFSDLDILIDPEQVAVADRVIREAGYEPTIPIRPGQQKLYMRSECDRTYLRRGPETHLELHWALTPPYFGVDLRATELIGRARTTVLDGRPTKTLSDEDLLLVLCVNGAKEMWEKLEWVTAVTTLLKSDRTLDWELIRDTARRTRTWRILLIGLGMARKVFDTKIPENLSAALNKDRIAQQLVNEAHTWLFADHFRGLTGWQLTRFRLSEREHWRDRVNYGWRRLFTPTHEDLAVTCLPRGLWTGYYLIRPFRLALSLVPRRRD